MEPAPTLTVEAAAGDAPAHPISLRSLAAEFREHLPIWFVYLEGIGLLHATLANFPSDGFDRLGLPRERFVPTAALPLAWFAAYFTLRIRRSEAFRASWKAWLSLAIAAALVPILILYGYRPFPLTHAQLSVVFEISQFTWAALFVAQAATTRGWSAVARFFGVTLLYGVLLENTGIVMGFFREPGFRLRLDPLPAPVCTMLGWSVVFYAVVGLVEQLARWMPWLSKGVARRAFLATAAALSLDAQLDPMASMSGVFWHWNETLPAGFLGVPIVNFAAWFGAFLPWSWCLFRVQDAEGEGAGGNRTLLLCIPFAAAVGGSLCFEVMALVEGVRGPSLQILFDFVFRFLP